MPKTKTMGLNKLRRALDVVKDQTSIGLAKMHHHSPSLSDLEVAIVKATRHEEYPPEEKNMRSILSSTSYSPTHVGACVTIIARRLDKTKNWAVALKSLMVIHRCLCDGNPWYVQEIFFSTRQGTRLLNMSDFCDMSRSDSWDFSAFVRTYALYIDEILEDRMQAEKDNKRRSYSNHEECHEENKSGATVLRSTPITEMKIEQLFSRTNHLVQIIERFLACRPTGPARENSLVLAALHPVIKESFYHYYDLTEMLGVLIDRFMDLDIHESIKVHEIFCRCSKQFDELYSFYSWSQGIGIVRISEYPEVEHISQVKLDVMDEFIMENIEIQKKSKGIKIEIQEEIMTEPEPDFNTIKALPPPRQDYGKKEDNHIVGVKVKEKKVQETGDLLNLSAEYAPTINERSDRTAIALFGEANSTGPPPWEAFKDNNSDWETALVQSASHLSNQRTQLPRGLDIPVLDGMYNHKGEMDNQFGASSGFIATGSASSVALGSAGRPAMLALPAPSMQNGVNNEFGFDPFAASHSIQPPSYVQMYDMEMKQRKLVEEQLIWQQYTREGMQGERAFSHMQPYPYNYNMGGHTQPY